jgi:serine/threonine protein kinase
LAHAHRAGYVHRDIKPHNILIGRQGDKHVVKVADFGLARAFEASQLSGMTLHGEFGGTPAFMAPEQVTHYREAKPPADQYSAAATLYYLLTGTYAFDFPNEITQLLIMILTEPLIPIQNRRADLPPELCEIIHKAMSRDPDDRFTDVNAFRAALAKFGK